MSNSDAAAATATSGNLATSKSPFYEKNAQLVQNVSQLQQVEQRLYKELENPLVTAEQRQLIVAKINDLSHTRAQLYDALKSSYENMRTNMSTADATLQDQMEVVRATDEELERARRRLNVLTQQTTKELRLTEINTYYSQRYSAYVRLLISIVIVCIPLIVVSVVYNYGLLPTAMFNLLVSGIIIFSLFWIGMQIIDISNRDSMNWNEYSWFFNPGTAPSTNIESSITIDPWAMKSITCIGAECCADGLQYDASNNRCVNAPRYDDTAAATTESFEGLEKYGRMAFKVPSRVAPMPVTSSW